jgi:hypothetical protein
MAPRRHRAARDGVRARRRARHSAAVAHQPGPGPGRPEREAIPVWRTLLGAARGSTAQIGGRFRPLSARLPQSRLSCRRPLLDSERAVGPAPGHAPVQRTNAGGCGPRLQRALNFGHVCNACLFGPLGDRIRVLSLLPQCAGHKSLKARDIGAVRG